MVDAVGGYNNPLDLDVKSNNGVNLKKLYAPRGLWGPSLAKVKTAGVADTTTDNTPAIPPANGAFSDEDRAALTDFLKNASIADMMALLSMILIISKREKAETEGQVSMSMAKISQDVNKLQNTLRMESIEKDYKQKIWSAAGEIVSGVVSAATQCVSIAINSKLAKQTNNKRNELDKLKAKKDLYKAQKEAGVDPNEVDVNVRTTNSAKTQATVSVRQSKAKVEASKQQETQQKVAEQQTHEQVRETAKVNNFEDSGPISPERHKAQVRAEKALAKAEARAKDLGVQDHIGSDEEYLEVKNKISDVEGELKGLEHQSQSVASGVHIVESLASSAVGGVFKMVSAGVAKDASNLQLYSDIAGNVLETVKKSYDSMTAAHDKSVRELIDAIHTLKEVFTAAAEVMRQISSNI